MLQALQDIENLPGSMSPTVLRDSHGHSVPNIRWSTQFAQIAGGRYQAGAEPSSTSPSSYYPLRNVYAELGTTMASMIVTFPTVWAHLIGQLLYYMGDDHIVFGSDSLWYGGPQWQIDALWRFQIPDQMQDKWKYPSLDYGAKRNILGLNSARLYGLYGSATQPVGTRGSPYKQGSLSGLCVVHAAREFDRRRVAGCRLPDADHAGQPASRRQLHQDEKAIRGDGSRSEQHPVRLDADERITAAYTPRWRCSTSGCSRAASAVSSSTM